MAGAEGGSLAMRLLRSAPVAVQKPTWWRAFVESNLGTRMMLTFRTTNTQEEMQAIIEAAHLRNFPSHGKVVVAELLVLAFECWWTFSQIDLEPFAASDCRLKVHFTSEESHLAAEVGKRITEPSLLADKEEPGALVKEEQAALVKMNADKEDVRASAQPTVVEKQDNELKAVEGEMVLAEKAGVEDVKAKPERKRTAFAMDVEPKRARKDGDNNEDEKPDEMVKKLDAKVDNVLTQHFATSPSFQSCHEDEKDESDDTDDEVKVVMGGELGTSESSEEKDEKEDGVSTRAESNTDETERTKGNENLVLAAAHDETPEVKPDQSAEAIGKDLKQEVSEAGVATSEDSESEQSEQEKEQAAGGITSVEGKKDEEDYESSSESESSGQSGKVKQPVDEDAAEKPDTNANANPSRDAAKQAVSSDSLDQEDAVSQPDAPKQEARDAEEEETVVELKNKVPDVTSDRPGEEDAKLGSAKSASSSEEGESSDDSGEENVLNAGTQPAKADEEASLKPQNLAEEEVQNDSKKAVGRSKSPSPSEASSSSAGSTTSSNSSDESTKAPVTRSAQKIHPKHQKFVDDKHGLTNLLKTLRPKLPPRRKTSETKGITKEAAGVKKQDGSEVVEKELTGKKSRAQEETMDRRVAKKSKNIEAAKGEESRETVREDIAKNIEAAKEGELKEAVREDKAKAREAIQAQAVDLIHVDADNMDMQAGGVKSMDAVTAPTQDANEGACLVSQQKPPESETVVEAVVSSEDHKKETKRKQDKQEVTKKRINAKRLKGDEQVAEEEEKPKKGKKTREKTVAAGNNEQKEQKEDENTSEQSTPKRGKKKKNKEEEEDETPTPAPKKSTKKAALKGDDERAVCPCGKSYVRKTSAYYRHIKSCVSALEEMNT